MDYQLKNKTAFITGSTSGIGFAVARLLAGEGSKVIINGRDQAGVDHAIAQLKQVHETSNVSGLVADFSIKESVEGLIHQLGFIDILVNNVGIYTSQSFTNTTDEDWSRLFEVNVMSGVRLARALLPRMIQKNSGRIIFVSSECAQLVPDDLIAYGTTKAALHSISRGLAQLTRNTAVTVNTIVPGSTLSEGAKKFLKEASVKEQKSEDEVMADFFKSVRTTSLISRFITTEEVAHAVLYLASPVSAATNGAVISVDGGSVPGIF